MPGSLIAMNGPYGLPGWVPHSGQSHRHEWVFAYRSSALLLRATPVEPFRVRILPHMSTLPPQPSPYLPAAPLRQAVVITDIDMPFGAMVRFIIKWVLASIPAILILWILLAILGGIVALLFGGALHTLIGAAPSHHY